MSHTLSLNITAMHCGSCVGRVEAALKAVAGVDGVSANIAVQSVRVTYDAPATPKTIVSTLRAAGYAPDEDTVTLSIEGMHCASCVGRVEAALSAGEGVVEARVNLANETAHIRYLSGAVTSGDLARLSTDAGYTAHLKGDGPDPAARRADEIASLRKMTLIAAALALPVFIIEMGSHLIPGMHHLVGQLIGHQTSRVVQFILTTAVLLGPGLRFYRAGYPALFRGAPDMNSLVAIGTTAAWSYSVIATFAPALLPDGARNVYFEAAAVIVVLVLAGRWMEARAKGRTGAAIQRLIALRPKTARVQRNGDFVDLPLDQVVLGDILQIRAGERVPTDGKVTDGQSSVNEAMITGEALAVQKSKGDAVTGGTVNEFGVFTMRATAVGEETVLAQILAMVEEAQSAKLPIQGLVDRITLYFVPAVLVIAVLTFGIWMIFGPSPALTPALVAAVSVLIIACPCAMGLATPTSIMVATGRAAELGVLFRKGDALQSLQDARLIAFDKTGTLTEGRPEVADVLLGEGVDQEALMAQVASLQTLSEHPLASAMLRASKAARLPVTGFLVHPGLGVQGTVGGAHLMVGSAKLMHQQDIEIEALSLKAEGLAEAGKTLVYVACDGQVAAVLGIADQIKPSTLPALKALRAAGLELAMITGDTPETARAIADRLGITHVIAGVMPDGKLNAIKELQTQGAVAFVGDGINDAPALAQADVGLAIGTGTDIAVEAADVVLASGSLMGVARAVTISRATMRNIRQNLGWAFGYNLLLVPVAAGALYPMTGLLLSPMLAAGAMALSSVAVLSNALRLRWVCSDRDDTPGGQPPSAPSGGAVVASPA